MKAHNLGSHIYRSHLFVYIGDPVWLEVDLNEVQITKKNMKLQFISCLYIIERVEINRQSIDNLSMGEFHHFYVQFSEI